MTVPESLTAGRPRIRIDGERAERLETDLIRLEAQADARGLARLEAVFLNWGSGQRGRVVDYVHFDRSELDLGSQIRVAFTVNAEEATVFDGRVTALGGVYPELRPPELTLLAEDKLMALRMRRRTRLSEEQTDGEIAEAIGGDAGIEVDCSLTGASHIELLQVNQDELGALRERAGDALIRLADGRLMITPAADESEPPIRLTRENELIRFQVLADLAHQRGEVRVHGWDVAAKEAIHEGAGADAIRPEAGAGRLGPEVIAAVFPDAAEDLHLEAPATVDEAREIAESAMRRRARRFVRGTGVTRGTPAMRVGSRLDLVDLGPWFGGVYLVTAVTHRFDQTEGYRTEFEAQRPHLGEDA
jgi:phage protein D